MSDRTQLDALAARHAELEAAVAAKTLERDVATRLLAEARATSRQPALDNIRVASPCNAAWSQMIGDERVRLCGQCNKHVFNLSHMTRDEAESLIASTGASLCVRYFQRADGTILLADCEINRKHKQNRRIVAIGATVLLAGGVLAYKLSSVDDRDVMMGQMAKPSRQIIGEMAPTTVPIPKPELVEVGGAASFTAEPPPPPPPSHMRPPEHATAKNHGAKKP